MVSGTVTETIEAAMFVVVLVAAVLLCGVDVFAVSLLVGETAFGLSTKKDFLNNVLSL